MSAVPSGIVQDLRLPGQEFDAETGLDHNGLRDYVPGWGRYLQSDPGGLAGGMNTYAYAFGNPLKWIHARGTVPAGTGGAPATQPQPSPAPSPPLITPCPLNQFASAATA